MGYTSFSLFDSTLFCPTPRCLKSDLECSTQALDTRIKDGCQRIVSSFLTPLHRKLYMCMHTHTVPFTENCTCACTHTHTVPFTENCTCAHTHTVPLACTLIEITLTEAMMDQCHTILRWDHKCDQPLHSLSSSQLLKCCWKTARVNDTAINKM